MSSGCAVGDTQHDTAHEQFPRPACSSHSVNTQVQGLLQAVILKVVGWGRI